MPTIKTDNQTPQESSELVYFKLQGEPLKDGIVDAKSAANLLLGIDDTIKYFISLDNPELSNIQIPITTRKGSWVVDVVDIAKSLAEIGGVTYLTSKYFGKAVEKMAEDDFKDVGFRKIFQAAGRKMIHVIKLAIHLKTLKQKKFNNVQFRDNNQEIGIPNASGEIMWVNTEVIEFLAECPQNLFSKLISPVNEDNSLSVGYDNLETNNQEKVEITINERYIFVEEEVDDDEIVLPELEHGKHVKLIGRVTRGNEKTNTIGFLYQGHILSCTPRSGNINSYKMALFAACEITGTIDRITREGKIAEKKPRIIFDSLKPLPKKRSNQMEIELD